MTRFGPGLQGGEKGGGRECCLRLLCWWWSKGSLDESDAREPPNGGGGLVREWESRLKCLKSFRFRNLMEFGQMIELENALKQSVTRK